MRRARTRFSNFDGDTDMNDGSAPSKPSALAGIRIADFSHFIAGPVCSLFLGDLGAEIIKIEKRHGGDDLRHIGPALIPGESGPYLWANRNKKSIAIDLSGKEGQQVARDIVDRSDVLLENFSTGVMTRLGLDYPTLAARPALNPLLDLICGCLEFEPQSAPGRS